MSTSKVYELLSSYEDFELAFTYTYLYKSYLPETKKIIDDLLQKRNLTTEKIKQLIEEKEEQEYTEDIAKAQCPRCKSFKVKSTQEILYYPAHNSTEGETPKYTHYYCSICGYDINNKEDAGDIRRWFKKIIHKLFKRKKIAS